MVIIDKKKLRDIYLKKRTHVLHLEVSKKSMVIARKLLKMPEIRGKRNFSVYLPINNEVDTKIIIGKLIEQGANIFVPYYSKSTDDYLFARFGGWRDLEEGPYKIPQPKNSHPQESGLIEVAIIPGVAFSKNGVRTGYGKGVFDRLLAKSNALKIGLAYDFQIVDEITHEEHDLLMDIIVTEKMVYRF